MGIRDSSSNRKGTAPGCAVCSQHDSRYSSVTTMLQSLNWETLQSCRLGKFASVDYLQSLNYNLAMFPLSDYATLQTVQTRGHNNNIKFILPHCSKDVYKHALLPVALRGWNALLQPVVESATLTQFKTSLPGATC